MHINSNITYHYKVEVDDSQFDDRNKLNVFRYLQLQICSFVAIFGHCFQVEILLSQLKKLV